MKRQTWNSFGASSSACQREPIAVVGMACRFPGGSHSLATFWQLLVNGRDGLEEVPADRWSAETYVSRDSNHLGRMITGRGGFVGNIHGFDAAFFGITPREASRMDPQQRLFMETAWDALEDAGIAPSALAGTQTGVFVGVSGHDFGILQLNPQNRYEIGAHTMTGVTSCIIPNRISYLLDLHGPSMAIDTACSSSLLATHLAVRSLREGESALAIVGGVNLLLNPQTTVGFSQGGFLSPDGSCKSFDSRANGYVRSEGAGCVILKPLSRALAGGDNIYAVIRGTSTNQDGRTNGMPVPSQDAQEALLRAACMDAGADPLEIRYVEAHGTGTAVGDPIEARALGRVLSVGRKLDAPVYLGAVKSNIGHLESAAGIAGLIKTCLVLKHGQIPPNAHFREPNPDIPFDELLLCVPEGVQTWPERGGDLAGVNSFGFGGASAHAILQRPPANERTNGRGRETPTAQECMLTLSAKSKCALEQYIRDYIEYLEGPGSEIPLARICAAAARRREHYAHRLAALANSHAAMITELGAALDGGAEGCAQSGQASKAIAESNVVFVFSGQGPQWWAMGRELLQHDAAFRKVIERCDAELSKHADWSLLEELQASEADSRIEATNIAQPAIFAIQLALAEHWQAAGINPSAVVGHSIGEVAAAYVCGALTFEDAIKVIFHRSRIQQKTSGQGKMLAVGMTLPQAQALVREFEGRVCIGAVNGQQSIALSGDPEPLAEIEARLKEQRIFARLLQVSVAFHSHQMDPLEAELRKSLADIRPRIASIPMYSTVTAQPIADRELDAGYWWENIREPVEFAPAIARQVDDGYRVFIELGPHPIHKVSIEEALASARISGLALGSLRRNTPERRTLLESLAELYVHGRDFDWEGSAEADCAWVKLPSYPWQRVDHWVESAKSLLSRCEPVGHPAVGPHEPSPDDPNRHVWTIDMDPRRIPWLEDHRVQGPIVFPGAGHMDLAMGCFEQLFGQQAVEILEVRFQKPLFVFDDRDPPAVKVVLQADRSFTISSMQPNASEWITNVVGRMAVREDRSTPPPFDIEELKQRTPTYVEPASLYAKQGLSGLMLGPTFQALSSLHKGPLMSLGRLDTPASIYDEAGRHCIHPCLLDSCFQSMSLAVGNDPGSTEKTLFVPSGIGRLTMHGRPTPQMWAYSEGQPQTVDDQAEGQLWILNDNGEVVVHIERFECTSITRQRDESDAVRDWLYDFQWIPRIHRTQTPLRADFLPRLSAVQQQVAPAVAAERDSDINGEYHDQAEPKIDALCVAYIHQALSSLGLDFTPGSRFTTEGAFASLGVAKQHRRFFGRLLQILGRKGLLRATGESWEVVDAPAPQAAPDALLEALREEHPAFEYEYKVLARCGANQAAVLRGEQDPIDLLFPAAELGTMADLYEVSASFSPANRIALEIVRLATSKLPADRPLRVIEIGAGTGGTTKYLLPALPADRVQYTFTDVGSLFVNSAQARFRDCDFIDFRELDIEREPAAQGFTSSHYDLVIASNVLHATVDLAATVRNARSLLAPGGCLLVMEATVPPIYADLTFGMTEGWWRFGDTTLRPNYALLTESRWQELLRRLEFSEVLVVSDKRAPEDTGNSVIVARTSEAEPLAAAPLDTVTSTPGAWLVLADEGRVGERFVRAVGADAEGSVLVYAGTSGARRGGGAYEANPTSADDLRQAIEKIRQSGHPFAGMLHLWSLNHANPAPTTSEIRDAEVRGCYSLIALTQAYKSFSWDKLPKLCIVTRGAQPFDEQDPVIPIQAATWGVLRVLKSELSELPATIIDLPAERSPDLDAARLAAEARYGTFEEEEVGFRGERRYVRRLMRLPREQFEERGVSTVEVRDAVFRADPPASKELAGLRYHHAARVEPAAGEVEVCVRATGLNFRDIMLSVGMLADTATHGGYYGPTIGVECAGVVTRVGEGVTRFAAGDRVAGVARSSFASFVVTAESNLFACPTGMSDVDAAAIPMGYLTAYQSLVRTAGLQRGERVLVHAGAGGVGFAAIQIALDLGAEVYATAGREEKRQFLRELGVKGVFDSRSLSFAQGVREATDGHGVDVVLNSLEGPFIQAGIDLLAPGGRFVEIGKKDIHENHKIGLKPFGNNLTYAAVDIDQMLLLRPSECQQILAEVTAKLANGSYKPLPTTAFPADRLEDAFRYMVAAKHTGKVVVGFDPQQSLRIVPELRARSAFRRDGSYLVIGGTSGFGLRTAQWIARNGAGTIVLASRRGALAENDEHALASMRGRGVDVVAEKVDVSDEGQVVALLERMRKLPPLRGIYQAAMVLDDAALVDMDLDTFLRAVTPKIDGTWHLHRHTLGMEIDQFVTYSSMSFVTGTPGQANYAAANAYLEALVKQRKASGQSGLNINWGVLGEVGFVARTNLDTLMRLGWIPVSPANALDVIGEGMLRGITTMSVAGIDWKRIASVVPVYEASKRYRHLITDAQGSEGAAGGGELMAKLRELPAEEAASLMNDTLVTQISRIFGMPANQLERDVPLTDLGMDSLMAGQIRNWTAGALGIDYPTMGLMRGPTLVELGADLLALTRGETVIGAQVVGGQSRAGSNPWIHCLQRRSESAGTRLFAFPFVGGGASVFNPWNELLPKDIEINAIQHPGREARIGEKPLTDIQELVRQVCAAIVPSLDRSFVLYGHSMGGLIAYEVARHLEAEYSEVPLRLIIAGWVAPPLVRKYVRALRGINGGHFSLEHASDAEVLEVLRGNALFSEQDTRPELAEALMPSVRADLAMLGAYEYDGSHTLRCPITVLSGDRDDLFDHAQLTSWRALTSGEFRFREVKGGHLFVREPDKSHIDTITEELRPTSFPVFGALDGTSAA